MALPQGYAHLTVNHPLNFVDPVIEACTNQVENMWKNAEIEHKALEL